MSAPANHHLRPNPLVLAAALFLVGLTAGRAFPLPAAATLLTASACLLLWMVAEKRRWPFASVPLALAIAIGGHALWQLDQRHVEPQHVQRWVPATGETPIALRAAVLVPPAPERRRDATFIARASEILTQAGWRPATGNVFVAWNAAESDLPRGRAIEIYGWAARPPAAANPGGYDRRKRLAADRVFVDIRVPRAAGIRLLDTAAAPSPLTSARTWLRAKLLYHIVEEDVPAAYAMAALLLGHRDPVISDVSQAFADAGVAHLLAISGSHIVFFAWIAWCLLMLLPLRPRWREVIIGVLVMAYVLATPCGPPIVRAAVVLVVVIVSRLAGRPRQYLNMLAAAAVVVVLLRPADIADAGFQLSFISTAGLILLSQRLYVVLFGPWIERRTLIAELAATPWARRRLLLQKWLCAALVANLIGAACALPLVALHFGQVNLWAVPAGIVALPVVSLAMIVAAVQLVAEILGAGAVFAGTAVFVGQAMIWLVQQLAALPGAALAIRPPPAWLATFFYATALLWIVRRRLGMSRAMAFNGLVAALVIASGWYAFTVPVGRLELIILDMGQASGILARLPDGALWAIDAGAARGSIGGNTAAAALRFQGERQLEGVLLTALDAPHAAAAADLVDRFFPRRVLVSGTAWPLRGQTLAGARLDAAQTLQRTPVISLVAGNAIRCSPDMRIDILWPPAGDPAGPSDLILCMNYQECRVLVADPRSQRALAQILLAQPGLRCDAIIFTGQERGSNDAALRRIIAPLQASSIIWTARGPWAPRTSSPGEWNAADGAVRLTFDGRLPLSIARAVPE